MKLKFFSFIMPIFLLATACGSDNGCPDANIDYVDAMMWNDIHYHSIDDEYVDNPEKLKVSKGREIGTIGYTLIQNACVNYKMKNGDATFLPTGTKVYEVEGYNPTFRLLADDKIYQSEGNPNATKISDVYDIENRVINISIESTTDGSIISHFTADATKDFTQEYLALKNVGLEKMYKRGRDLTDQGKIFLRIHLEDGTSFRIVYWTEENLITPGAIGTERLKSIALQQMK